MGRNPQNHMVASLYLAKHIRLHAIHYWSNMRRTILAPCMLQVQTDLQRHTKKKWSRPKSHGHREKNKKRNLQQKKRRVIINLLPAPVHILLPISRDIKKMWPGGERTPPFFIKRKRLWLLPAAENPRTLAHAREGQTLQRAQREDFFNPWAEIHPSWDSNSRPRGSDATGLG